MSRRSITPVVLDVRVVVGAGGGPEKTILNSPRFLDPYYRNLCVYMQDPADPGIAALRERARQAGAPFLSIADRGPSDWTVVVELLNLCRRERVAIWHGHDYKSNLLGILLARFWKMALVTTVHGWVHHSRRTALYYALDRWCLPRFQSVISVSRDLHESMPGYGVAPDRAVLIENGIDAEQVRRTLPLRTAQARLGVPPGRLVVGSVGRLSAEKGFDLLIQAADRILRQGKDIEIWIVGAGDERAALQRLIETLGQQERIRLLGYRDDTAALYQAMDVFVSSSLREGLPNVLLEAMALETPVLGTRIAGVPHLIEDGSNGVLVAPGSVEALTAGLLNLLDSEDLRQRLGQAGRRTVETRFSFRVRMDKVRCLYDRLLAGPAAETRFVRNMSEF